MMAFPFESKALRDTIDNLRRMTKDGSLTSLKLCGLLQVALVIPVPALISLFILKDALSFIVCECISRKLASLIAEKAQTTAYVFVIPQIPWFVF